MGAGTGDRQGRIEALLREFHATPGRYALARREPEVLFGSIREILQLASGRAIDDVHTAPSGAARIAACFFIRAAMLHPDADHYTLLGLRREADAGALKERYRQLMRVLHPDFTAGTSWPADAATRINRAYDELSSPVRRREYDARLAGQPATTNAGEHPRPLATQRRPMPATAPVSDGRGLLRKLALACGAAGGFAVIGWIFATGSEKESLVQRERVEPAPLATRPRAETVQAGGAAPSTPPSSVLERAMAAFKTEAALQMRVLQQQPAREATHAQAQAEPTPAPRPQQAAYVALAPPPAMAVAAADTQIAANPPMPPASLAPPPVVAAVQAVQAVQVAPTAPTAPPPALPGVPITVAAAAPYAGPTMADVQPFLTRLVHEMESGWGDHVLSVLDRPARITPAAQSVVAQFNEIVDGRRPVKVSSVQFHSRPRDSRLVVTGRLLLLPRDADGSPREFALEAEFARRDGEVTMVRLARSGP